MKVLLLNPINIYESWPIPGDFWRYMGNVMGVTFPQLASVLEDVETKIYDGFIEGDSLKKYFKLLSEYEVIAISAVSSSAALNIELTIKLAKAISKHSKIILGGHHATAYAEEWIKKGADIVIKNEGEITFKEVVNALNNKDTLAGVKGIAFKEQGEIIHASDREFIESLDDLPLPRWDLVNLHKYNQPWKKEASGGLVMVETSRGCSFGCSFCSASWMWKNRQRYKTVNRVVEEIKLLYGNGIRNIGIADDNFGNNYERDMGILERIIKSGVNINLWMFCRADTVLNHSDFVKTASRAGLNEVFVGFESLEKNKLNDFRKNLVNFRNISEYKTVYKIFKQNNVLVFGSFVSDILDRSKPFFLKPIKYNHVCDIAMHQYFMPMKGTPDYNKLHGLGLLATDSFYSDRLIMPFKFCNFKKSLSLFIESFCGIFNLNSLQFIFSAKKENQRHKFRILNIYKSLLKCSLKFSNNKIIVFLKCLNPLISQSSKQLLLLKRYLDTNFISNLMKSNMR